MVIRFLDEPRASQPTKSRIRFTDEPSNAPLSLKADDIAKEAGQYVVGMAKNIPTDIYKTAKGLANVAGQTTGNVLVDPKYALKTAGKDIVQGVKSLAQLPGQGLKSLTSQPFFEKTLPDIGKYLQENPASTAFDILTLSPKTKIWSGIAKKLEDVGTKVTRRGMGFTPSMLEERGALELANKSANEVLKRELIPWHGSAETVYQKVLGLEKETGEALGGIRNVLQESGKKSFNPLDLDDEIVKQLTKQFTTPTDRNALKEIRKLILDRGLADDLDFKTADDLVKTLQRKSKYDGLVKSETDKAVMYQKASGIARDMRDKTALKATREMGLDNLFQDYMNLKELYNKVEIAFDGMSKVRGKLAAGEMTGILTNPLIRSAISRATFSTGKTLGGLSKTINKTPIKSLYYSGRAEELKKPEVNPLMAKIKDIARIKR